MTQEFPDQSNPLAKAPKTSARPVPLPPNRFPGQGGLGSVLLMAGAALAVLVFIDRGVGLPFEMPRSWYSHETLWWFLAFGSFLSGVFLLKSETASPRQWQPDRPGRRFQSVGIYTRAGCHLCDQAKDVLWAYQAWLPEIQEIDVAADAELTERFSEQIPVVEIDGRVRFRGQVNETLLRRLIDAEPPQQS